LEWIKQQESLPERKRKFMWQFQKHQNQQSGWAKNGLYIEGIATRYSNFANEPALKCTKCTKVFSHPYRSGGTTTTLNRHRCNVQIQTEGNDQTSIKAALMQRTPLEKLTAALVREEVLKFFITGNIPFAQADNQHLKNLVHWIKTIDEQTVAISRKVIRNLLTNGSKEAREDLRYLFETLDSKVSLALDAWSSHNGYSFLGNSPESHTNCRQINDLHQFVCDVEEMC
jgi:hypothetical protein